MASATLTAIEKAVAPIALPFVSNIWISTLAPAIQAKLKSGSPEIQILENELMALLNGVVAQEVAQLQSSMG